MNKIEIQDALKKDKIVLFMKGTRTFPQCGFSGRMIDILGQFNVEYKEYDVLQDSELRENIKSFSEWPTIPQLYVDGEFIGGSDIVYEMYEDKTIEKVLLYKEGDS
jgi:monothiol glutaredoxin|tara:strand:- start:100 stop:417 length:318 start_codon:yes stop_codon:yes gene_type:complete